LCVYLIDFVVMICAMWSGGYGIYTHRLSLITTD